MTKCYIDDFNGCCCICKYQTKIHCHPWNESETFKGKISESFGFGCSAFMREDYGVIFNECGHGMCEMFAAKD